MRLVHLNAVKQGHFVYPLLNRGSINYLAVDPQFSGHGFGRVLVQAAEEFLRGIGCPKN